MMRNTVLCVALLGATLAADEKEVEEQKAKLRLKLADHVLRDAKVTRDERERAAKRGHLSMAELSAARTKYEDARTRRAIRALDLEEVQATGRAPTTSVTAPKVGDRDFVLARLDLQAAIAKRHFQLLAMKQERVKKLHKAGAVTSLELATAEANRGIAFAALQQATDTVGIRKRYLDKASGTSAEEAELKVLSFDATFRMRRAESRLPAARARYAELAAGMDAGAETQLALRAAVQALVRIETEHTLARIDFRQVGKKLAVR